MKDCAREMLDVWSSDGVQAAYDIAPSLVEQIEAEIAALKRQSEAIRAVVRYLEQTDIIVTREPPSGLDAALPKERPGLIVEAAVAVWRRLPSTSGDCVKVEAVLQELESARGIDLGVKQPLAVVGTVLARATGFTKVARNTFKYDPSSGDSKRAA